MKSQESERRLATDVEGMIIQISKAAEERMDKTEDAEEYAFLFGHINFAAAIINAVSERAEGKNGVHYVGINLDFENAHNAYQNAKREREETKCDHKQMSMEDILPGILSTLDRLIERLESKPKKSSTTKKPSSKKE